MLRRTPEVRTAQQIRDAGDTSAFLEQITRFVRAESAPRTVDANNFTLSEADKLVYEQTWDVYPAAP